MRRGAPHPWPLLWCRPCGARSVMEPVSRKREVWVRGSTEMGLDTLSACQVVEDKVWGFGDPPPPPRVLTGRPMPARQPWGGSAQRAAARRPRDGCGRRLAKSGGQSINSSALAVQACWPSTWLLSCGGECSVLPLKSSKRWCRCFGLWLVVGDSSEALIVELSPALFAAAHAGMMRGSKG